MPDQKAHMYMSTGCFHDDHDYCQATTGLHGEKHPGRCKFCAARCVCPCHTTTPEPTQ